MKKLSKLHLRSEQYLTDSEMKLISGGADGDNVYYDCPYNPGGEIEICHTGKRCIKKDYPSGVTGGYTMTVGVCMDKSLGGGKWSCECV